MCLCVRCACTHACADVHAHVHVCVAQACNKCENVSNIGVTQACTKCENVSNICVMYVRVCICVCVYVCLHVCVRSCAYGCVCVLTCIYAAFTHVSTNAYYMRTIHVRPHMMATSLHHVVQKEQAVESLKAVRWQRPAQPSGACTLCSSS